MNAGRRALLPLLVCLALFSAACTPQTFGPGSTYSIWSTCGGPCTLKPGGFMTADVPDTFDVQMSVHSNQSLGVGVLTNYSYADFIACFQSKRGTEPEPAYHCLQEAANLNGSQLWTGNSIDFDFEDAEGCAGYLMVVAADTPGAAKITPNEQITYKPASQPTGICTQSLSI